MDLEERKLWELYKRTGRSELQEKLVIKYLNLVHFLANRLVKFSSSSLDKDDLYSAGTIGLLEAIERFDLDKNVEFKTFASLRIKGAIIDEIRRFDWVPRSVRKKSKMIDSTVHRLFSELNRLPSDEEIAKELEISIDEYYQITDSIGPLYLSSLDTPIESESGEQQNYIDMLSDEYDADVEHNKQVLKESLVESIQNLPERERLVISLYYYENLNLKEIGAVLEVTESRVSQIHSSAISKLRTMLQRKINE
jgi:RNA polymerase sigma factor for flagellar operon FliA